MNPPSAASCVRLAINDEDKNFEGAGNSFTFRRFQKREMGRKKKEKTKETGRKEMTKDEKEGKKKTEEKERKGMKKKRKKKRK